MEKCEVCGRDSVIVLDGKPLCSKDYVDQDDEECLHWEAVRLNDEIKNGSTNTRSREILAEIMKKYPNILSRENEFGELITEDELAVITERIRKLKPEQMDALWHQCGYIFANPGASYKALREIDIKEILKNRESAMEKVWSLISETHLNDVEKALAELEGQ